MKTILRVCVLALCLAACAPASTTEPSHSAERIQISDAEVRLAAGGATGEATSLAGYLVIANTGTADDRLLGISADFAGAGMLHQTVVDANGVATMTMLQSIDVPAGKTVSLAPGGYHVMFTDPRRDLKAGDRVVLTLTFEQSGIVVLTAVVTEP